MCRQLRRILTVWFSHYCLSSYYPIRVWSYWLLTSTHFPFDTTIFLELKDFTAIRRT